MFHIGQKVVCVDETPVKPDYTMDGLTKGHTYTIRWIGKYTHPLDGLGQNITVRLEELCRKPSPIGSDVPFLARRFRPLIEKSTETGMAILRKILKTKKVETVE